LNPRIVAGIASRELYAAIAAFEAKHFPGQGSGYFDPGGAMFKKLVALATPAATPPAPAPAAPPPPAAPTSGPIPRPLTTGEKALLLPLFGNTIDYANQSVGRNDGKWGGKDNSITPSHFPKMALSLWSWDYSLAPAAEAAVFVHEMVHVWQWGHGSATIRNFLKLVAETDGEYEKAYKYDLATSNKLTDFNMEQQAAIIQDHYRLSKGLAPEENVGTRKSAADYAPYVLQLTTAGAFRWPKSPRIGTSLERPL
jgi:hypothetical protein